MEEKVFKTSERLRRRTRAGQRYQQRRSADGTDKCDFCGWLNRYYSGSGASLLETHHVIPVRYGGTDDDSNLVLLCPNHHRIADLYYRSFSFARVGPITRDDLFKYLRRVDQYCGLEGNEFELKRSQALLETVNSIGL